MRLTIKVPHWLIGWMFKDLEGRTALTGKASSSKRWFGGRLDMDEFYARWLYPDCDNLARESLE